MNKKMQQRKPEEYPKLSEDPFPNLNVDRNRRYGLRIGDIVGLQMVDMKEMEIYEVAGFASMDNNECYLRSDNGNMGSWTCEHLKRLLDVEDRIK